MNVAIVGRNSPIGYSGGRYHIWGLAEAIAVNHNILYFTNAKPAFYSDFLDYPKHSRIELIIVDDKFSNMSTEKDIDIIVFVPGMDRDDTFYRHAIYFAKSKKAHIIFINFESPNWFNSLSVVQRDLTLWDPWKHVANYSSCILSISKEGLKFAESFYQIPDEAFHDYCYPMINTFVADRVISEQGLEKEKKIIMTARFALAEHKGSNNIPDLICEAMRGYTFVIVVGYGEIPKYIDNEIQANANKYGVNIEYKFAMNDFEKFCEIGKSRLLLFPSFFEGYGYPPIEAQYMNTDCLAFNIPVLMETSPNIDMVHLGDWEAFVNQIKKILSRPVNQKLHSGILNIAEFDIIVKKVDSILKKLENKPIPNVLASVEKTDLFKNIVRKEVLNPTVTNSNLKKQLIMKILGIKYYELLKFDYSLYRNKQINRKSLMRRILINQILKRFLSDRFFNKLKAIYKILKS